MGFPIAIIGAGTAAVAAIATLREEGFDGDIVMFGDEGCMPYERASLSSTFAPGFSSCAATELCDMAFYRTAEVRMNLNDPVLELNAASHTISTRNGTRLRYDKALIATGTSSRRLDIPGADLPSVHHVHSAWDATLLARSLASVPRVVVIGAGFLACEIAAAARAANCEVTIVSPRLPMEHVLGPAVGAIVAETHRAAGVAVETAHAVAINGKNDVRSVSLSDGRRIACRIVVVAIGTVPNSAAVPSHLCSDGVVVDEFCRTAADDVYAAGSVANAWRPRTKRRVRDGHADHAREHGRYAARSIIGRAAVFDPIPSFVSIQHDRRIEFAGEIDGETGVVIERKPDGAIESRYVTDGVTAGVCRIDAAPPRS